MLQFRKRDRVLAGFLGLGLFTLASIAGCRHAARQPETYVAPPSASNNTPYYPPAPSGMPGPILPPGGDEFPPQPSDSPRPYESERAPLFPIQPGMREPAPAPPVEGPEYFPGGDVSARQPARQGWNRPVSQRPAMARETLQPAPQVAPAPPRSSVSFWRHPSQAFAVLSRFCSGRTDEVAAVPIQPVTLSRQLEWDDLEPADPRHLAGVADPHASTVAVAAPAAGAKDLPSRGGEIAPAGLAPVSARGTATLLSTVAGDLQPVAPGTPGGATGPSSHAAAPRPLNLGRTALCTEVRGYEDCTEVDPARLVPGQPVLLYVALTGFRTQQTPRGWQTQTRSTLEIVGAHGTVLARNSMGAAIDLATSPRENYFLTHRLNVPARLSPGCYVLRLTVTDLAADQTAVSELPIGVRADRNHRGETDDSEQSAEVPASSR